MNLSLFEDNPRFEESVGSQREAINAILADAPAKLVALATDIAREGVNPTELPVVVMEDERTIVLEGNRRIAALKLLNNPDLADHEEHRRQFRNAGREGLGPDIVTCVVAETAAEADHWLQLRHTGENGGVGVVPWNPGQQYHFEQQRQVRRNRGSQRDRAMTFCNAVSAKFPNDPDLLYDIATVRRERLTTLGRLVGDPEVRAAIGFEFGDDDVLFHYPDHRLLAAVSRLFSDLAGDLSVSKVKSKSQRREYIGSIENELPPRAERLKESTSAAAGSASPSSSSPGESEASAPQRAAPRRRAPQEKCIFQGLRMAAVDLRTSEVLREAQRIDIDTSPNIAAVMLRVVIDLAVTEAAEQQGWKRNQEDLKGRILVVLNKLDPKVDDPELVEARRHAEPQGQLGLKTLHAFVHAYRAHPLTTDIRKLSLAFRPMLEKLDVYLKANKQS